MLSLVTPSYVPFQSCDFVWVPAEWEGCTTTCGSRGMQEREVFCVHNRTDSNDPPWQHMVHPEQCRMGVKPETTRPCNQIPCPAHWVSGNWSQVCDEQEMNLPLFCQMHLQGINTYSIQFLNYLHICPSLTQNRVLCVKPVFIVTRKSAILCTIQSFITMSIRIHHWT